MSTKSQNFFFMVFTEISIAQRRRSLQKAYFFVCTNIFTSKVLVMLKKLFKRDLKFDSVRCHFKTVFSSRAEKPATDLASLTRSAKCIFFQSIIHFSILLSFSWFEARLARNNTAQERHNLVEGS